LLPSFSYLRPFAKKLEETGFSKASVHFPQTVWLYMSLDSNFHIHSVCLGLEILWNLMCEMSAVLVMATANVGWQSQMVDYNIWGGGRTHTGTCQSIKVMIM
jgi:hypothetical protein